MYWNYDDKKADSDKVEIEVTETKKGTILRYYSVYNIAQCAGIVAELVPDMPARTTEPIQLVLVYNEDAMDRRL